LTIAIAVIEEPLIVNAIKTVDKFSTRSGDHDQKMRKSKIPSNVTLFAWLINHQPAVLFSQNKPATSNQPAVLFSQDSSTSVFQLSSNSTMK
jgi:hypothetical protein